MRETIELLKEESLMKNELLAKYEREQQKGEDEVQFYKKQNQDLMKRLDEYESQMSTLQQNTAQMEQEDHQGRNSVINLDSKIETSSILKNENGKLNTKIQSLKGEIMQTELDKKKLESVKADLEYNLRASEYNVEILKNQNENLNTELTLLKKHSDKQKKYIMMQR